MSSVSFLLTSFLFKFSCQHVSFLVNLYYFRLRTVWRYQSVIRSRKIEKGRKHKGQTRRDKKTNNDPQNTTKKSLNNTNPTTRHDELSFAGRVSASCSISDARQSIHINDLTSFYIIYYVPFLVHVSCLCLVWLRTFIVQFYL